MKLAIAAALAIATTASAQPAQPEPATPTTLAQVKGDKELTAALSAITSDPAIPVDDPKVRPLAQALMIEGVRQLQAHAYDQALANFLDAYAKFPSPKILLNVASTLRDMGRLADAANTYQRYLTDPATGAERVGEVKELLLRLDEQLTILTVRVDPHGSDISIDGGPFITVGTSLLTRVRPGIHLVRVRRDDAISEVPINGFEAENKEVAAKVVVPPPDPTLKPPPPSTEKAAPDHVDAWLNDSTRYATTDATGRSRTVVANNVAVASIVPRFETSDSGDVIVHYDTGEPISSGVIGVVRIDGKGRGFAGGAGLAIAGQHLEGEIMFLKSDETGGYLGGRYRLFTGWLRPYVGVGVPGFLYDKTEMGSKSKKLAVGIRGAAGLEVVINGHLSVQGDLGYEHFFGIEGTNFEADVFVPTIGVIARL